MIKEFFGLAVFENGSYHFARTAEGAWSWQHILQVSLMLIVMAVLAVVIGKRFKNRSLKEKNKVIAACAIIINSFEIVKIVVLCIRTQNPFHWIYVLPLFLCSIQLIALPLAAFCKGRIKEAALDFVLTFGILGGVFGTVGAVQNYSAYPVFSMDNVFSGVTHCISAFASLYIMISGMISLKKKNVLLVLGILLSFAIVAYVVNVIIDYNYMFLMYHDGTPYSIFYDIVGGSAILYPLVVVGLFVIYYLLFFYVYQAMQKKREQKKNV